MHAPPQADHSPSPLLFSIHTPMEKRGSNTFVFFFLLPLFLFSTNPTPVVARSWFSPTTTGDGDDAAELQTYIVHVKQPTGNAGFAEDSEEDREKWYKSFLPTTAMSSTGSRMVYSYGNVISGFAARLTREEVKAMEKKDGFLQAHPDRVVSLQTTHTPTFLGLNPQDGFLKGSNFGNGVIIGVLDTGVLPDHPSFSGDGIPPPPSKWKGRCDFNASLCNNKLIGARMFIRGAAAAAKGGAAAAAEAGAPTPPVDEEGHGTHTASTAAGRFVSDADVLGNARGTAVGMAPHAHLAIYKVCGILDCADSDILAAMDAAVADGVDVLSLSIGGDSVPFFMDGIALGAFGAIEKGVFVSCAAGNFGPFNSTLSNEAPWILTVAASTMDRNVRSTVKLGNGVQLDGESLFQPKDFKPTLLPLVFAGASGKPQASLCGNGSLDGMDVKGKVVLCERGGGIARIEKGFFVKNAGGAAMILMNAEQDGYSTLADAHVLPASHVGYVDGSKIKSYINSSNSPTATLLFKGTLLGISPAPVITSFSSRGPSLASPGILKPDITGPGVSVLAAWAFPVGPDARIPFNIISGTSMSTPHLSGIAALLKSAHPDWSPAAIKSAIMTSADITDRDMKPIADERLLPADFFAVGAGHVNPTKANDPGLVYDLGADDYVPYLCGLGYSDKQVQAITRRPVSCAAVGRITEGELNYPSIMVTLGAESTYATLKRTVKNVGEAHSTYTVRIYSPVGVSVTVKPSTLQFSAVNEEKSFTVTFTGSGGGAAVSQGYLVWVSNEHVVHSPISVKF